MAVPTFHEKGNQGVAALITTIGFAATLSILVWRGNEYFMLPSDSTSYGFFALFDALKYKHLQGGTLVFYMISVHYVRMYMGLYFMIYDTSLRKALNLYVPDHDRRHNKIVLTRWIGLIMVLSIVAFLLTVRMEDGRLLAMILAIQAILITTYDMAFFNIIFRLDRQRAANVFIGMGDLAFSLFVVLVVIRLINPDATYLMDWELPFIIGSYTAIFIGEFLSQYMYSLRRVAIQAASYMCPKRRVAI